MHGARMTYVYIRECECVRKEVRTEGPNLTRGWHRPQAREVGEIRPIGPQLEGQLSTSHIIQPTKKKILRCGVTQNSQTPNQPRLAQTVHKHFDATYFHACHDTCVECRRTHKRSKMGWNNVFFDRQDKFLHPSQPHASSHNGGIQV